MSNEQRPMLTIQDGHDNGGVCPPEQSGDHGPVLGCGVVKQQEDRFRIQNADGIGSINEFGVGEQGDSE
jgi:hypothetical protein